MKKCFMLLFLVLVFLNCFAQEFEVNTGKQSFMLGEIVPVNVTVSNNESNTQLFQLSAFIEDEKGYFQSIPVLEEIEVPGFSERTLLLDSLEITEHLLPGKYTAVVYMGQEQKQVEFEITGTKDLIKLTAGICRELDCGKKESTFILGKTVFISVSVVPENAAIELTLIKPDETIELIESGYSFVAEEIGSYSLQIKASAPNYWNQEIIEGFAVIKKSAEIPFMGKCNANGSCEQGETLQNCPQDCGKKAPKKDKEDSGEAGFYLVLVLSAGLLALLIITVLLKQKSKRKRFK